VTVYRIILYEIKTKLIKLCEVMQNSALDPKMHRTGNHCVEQACQTRGPRAACGPRLFYLRPVATRIIGQLSENKKI